MGEKLDDGNGGCRSAEKMGRRLRRNSNAVMAKGNDEVQYDETKNEKGRRT